jgi:hypothetical protein
MRSSDCTCNYVAVQRSVAARLTAAARHLSTSGCAAFCAWVVAMVVA